MSAYKPAIAPPRELTNPRWLCGCGQTAPYREGNSYPICRCGQRMRMLDAENLESEDGARYVGTPAERLATAKARHWEAYEQVMNGIRSRFAWDRYEISDADWADYRGRAEHANWLAEDVDRVEASVEACK